VEKLAIMTAEAQIKENIGAMGSGSADSLQPW